MLENIEYRGLVSLDIETRWNSTFLMLEVALKYKNGFEELELRDKQYRGIAPEYSDWEFVRLIFPFLKIFHDVTLRISGLAYVTRTMYMSVAFGIGSKIKQMSTSRDVSVSVRLIHDSMKKKYDKYWGSKIMNWLIVESFDGKLSKLSCELRDKVEFSLISLFEKYVGSENQFEGSSQKARLSEGGHDDPYGFNQFFGQLALINLN